MTIIRSFDKEKDRKIDIKYLTFLIIFVSFLVILKIWVNNIISSYGEKLERTSNLQESFVLENEILENEIARFSSLQVVLKESQMLGFSGPKSIKYIP